MSSDTNIFYHVLTFFQGYASGMTGSGFSCHGCGVCLLSLLAMAALAAIAAALYYGITGSYILLLYRVSQKVCPSLSSKFAEWVECYHGS
jgi:hypothetical protein